MPVFFRQERKVSQLVVERGGVDLMPELGYEPTNKYLPPRARQTVPVADVEAQPTTGLKAWVNKMIAR